MVVDSMLYVPRIVCGGSVLGFVLLCTTLYPFYFSQSSGRGEKGSFFALIVFLVSCDC